MLYDGHVLLKPVGAFNQGVVLFNALRQDVGLDLHHRAVAGVGAQRACERDDTTNKDNNIRFQTTS